MLKFEISSEPSEADADRIGELLSEHSLAKGVVWDQEPLHILLRDGGKIVGGLIGKTVCGWLHIGRLAVSSDLRGQGYGRRLMQEAERIALERGCHSAWLDTHSFQAPGFYERLGYSQFGMLEDHPIGERRYFFAKRLSTPEAGR